MELSKKDTRSIKGIAILLMLWHHLFLSTSEYGEFASSFATVSKVCVAIFLFVSGYGLTKQYCSLEKRDLFNTLRLLLRRFINFFFPYWFCFLLVVMIGNIFGYSFQEAYPATRNTLKCVILDFWGQMGYDSYLKPWWFNKMIIQLYILFPVLYILLRNCYSALSGLIAIIIVQLYAAKIPGNIFFIVEGGLPAFYLGMLLSRFQIVPEIREKKWGIVTQCFSVLIVSCVSILLLRIVDHYPYPALLLRAFLALCIVFAYKSFSRHKTVILDFFGKYSTILYLIHVLLLIIVPQVVYYPGSASLVFLLFTAICLSSAIIIDWLERTLHYDKLRQTLVSYLNYR